MQTLVAYAMEARDSFGGASAALARVQAYYGRWSALGRREGMDAESVGAHIWSIEAPKCLWPAWAATPQQGVASLYTPLGYERVVGGQQPHEAAVPLATALVRDHLRICELAPPFVLATVDSGDDRLDLFTDLMGVGRLFELRTPQGWVWSNRPAAAALFAGIRAIPDMEAWRYQAACTWSMADTTPYERVLAVPGGTKITYRGKSVGRVVTSIDAASIWGSHHTGQVMSTDDNLDETVAALQATARSIGRLWPQQPTVDLSGGRDSRLVTATFLSAGVDIQIHSHDGVPGEADVAEHLVSLLGSKVEHVVRRQPPGGTALGHTTPALDLVERVRAWHRFSEGLRPASFLWHTPPQSLAQVTGLVIGGVGGEIGHGHFYPPDLAEVGGLDFGPRLDRFVNGLTARIVPAVGPSSDAREAVRAQCRRVLRTAVSSGMQDATMLDYFWVNERLRRWGMTGERMGLVSPLLATEFALAAFSLVPAQRVENALHRALLRRMVQPWADVPFFKAPPPDRPAPVRRLARASDRDLIQGILLDDTTWPPDFDRPAILRLWDLSLADTSTSAQEMVLWRVLWRAVFEDHLAEVNLEAQPERRLVADIAGASPALSLTAPTPLSYPRWAVVLQRHAKRSSAARRLVATQPGRLGLRIVRSRPVGRLLRPAARP